MNSLLEFLRRKQAPEADRAKKPELGQFAWLLHREPTEPIPHLVYSADLAPGDDYPLVRRVMDAYKLSFGRYQPSASGWDMDLAALKKESHDALIGDDVARAAELMRNPAETTLFWGFDAIAKAPPGFVEPHENVILTLSGSQNWRLLYALWLFDSLSSVAEAIGARRVSYLETEPSQVGIREANTRNVDQIIDQIDRELGLELRFPNPFAGELGLASTRGVIGFRAIQALYQAWRIAQLARGKRDFKVLEIGAGLGRTAYFASAFGIKNYTIMDIPLTNAAQAYFLGCVLGADAITLAGEPVNPASVDIRPATMVEGSNETYDLIVNVDSWTEMSPEVAKGYWDYAKLATRTVLSINHEHNLVTVRSLYSGDPAVHAIRFPYWPRRGYVEELITW